MLLLHCSARQARTRLCNSLRLKLIADPCRLTGLTSLRIHLDCISSLRALDFHNFSQLRQLKELQLDGYTGYGQLEELQLDGYTGYGLHGNLLAHLPLSLTSLSLLDKPYDEFEYDKRMESLHERDDEEEDEGGEINAKIAMGRLANLQHFKFCGDRHSWASLLGPLASISGLSDLDVDFYDLRRIASLSCFGHLTRLKVTCFTADLNAGLGHISVLSGLQELHLEGIDQQDDLWSVDPDAYGSDLAGLSSLPLLTSLTLVGLRPEGVSWLTCPPTLGRGVQDLGLLRCRLSSQPKLYAAPALRSLDVSYQALENMQYLSGVIHSNQLTFLDVSCLKGLESQHLWFLSELKSLVELKIEHNAGLNESVLPLLHPLSSLCRLDVSLSPWLCNTGLIQIAGIQGLSELALVMCDRITLPGIAEMVSRGSRLTRVALGQALHLMPGYYAGIERRLRGPVGACDVYSLYGDAD